MHPRVSHAALTNCARLQAKYVGTGHADLTRFEWAVNIHRDSYASYVGHHSLVGYMALAENESVGREKYSCLQKMLQPCGLPPLKPGEAVEEDATA